ncbi:MAG: thioredoxin-dependent peroxiredoxin [Bacteroidales bacterium]|jgi:peroxiredoxin Q/BCP|nr:thioredoxin-dependent peroxiredoxin [Bacteroidales bacterium]MDN5328296.1 thioredoxin-dependent peroxiredoxin [Bacteroidales bacterium]
MNHPLINQPAPDFTATSYEGIVFTPSLYRGQKNIVLFFYPKDDSIGCTAEACAFRDSMPTFEIADTLVVGISPDSLESHKAFAKKHGITYPLLSDPEGKIRKLYQVPRDFLGLLPGRVTYVIDRNGIIRGVFRSAFQFKRHVEEALQMLNM